MGKMHVKSESSSGQQITATTPQIPTTEKQYGIITDLIAAGEIQGLVSIEDIFEEIVGNFESGKDELEKEFIKLKDGSILTDGNSRIRDINNYLNWKIPEYKSKTINGLVTEQLDQIPQTSLCLEIEKYRFEILELDENLISKIKIKKI